MFKKTLISLFGLIAVFALAIPAAASAAGGGARSSSPRPRPSTAKRKAASIAVKDGHLNQLTEDPTDSEPNFSPDGRTIAFVRGGDIYSIRPDGSGQRQLTNGPEVDSLPKIAPNGRYVVFERRGCPRRPLRASTASASPAAASTVVDHRRRQPRCGLLAGRQDDRLRPLDAGRQRRQRRPLLGPPQRQRDRGA